MRLTTSSPGSTDNIEALKQTIRDALSAPTPLSTSNGNQWAEIEGDLAQAGCYFTVHMYKEGLADGEHFEMGGRYDDELIRASDGMAIFKESDHHLYGQTATQGAMAD